MLGSLRHLVFSILFAVAIAAPWVVNVMDGPDPARDLAVSRPRAEKPDPLDAAELEEFPGRYGAWLDDSFGLRSHYLRWHNRIKLTWLGVSPADNLIVGKDGWLFATDDLVVENHRGVMPLTEEELRHWKDALEERRDWLLSRGARYVVFMPPDKHGIYAEMTPDALGREGAASRYEQWLPYMAANADVEIVDLYGPLREAKSDGHVVYFPLGTHWTIPGAFVGSRAVIERVAKWFPGMAPQSWEDFDIVSTTDHPGDSWGAKLLIEDLLSQPVVGLERRAPLPFRRVDSTALAARFGVHVTVTVHEDASLPSAVMFHDSFAPAMMDFLSCHFSRVVYFWSPVFKHEIVLEESPDVVLHERVERFLAYLPPRLSPPQKRELAEWRRRGSPDPRDDPAAGFAAGRFFNPGVGHVEVRVIEAPRRGIEVTVDGEARRVEVKSRRVLEDRRGWRYVMAPGGGSTLTVTKSGNSTAYVAYRTAPSDARHDLGRYAADYRGEALTFQVRCLDGRLVVFAQGGEQASALVGEGPGFAVVDRPGMFVEFSELGMRLRINATESLDAVRVKDEEDGGD